MVDDSTQPPPSYWIPPTSFGFLLDPSHMTETNLQDMLDLLIILAVNEKLCLLFMILCTTL